MDVKENRFLKAIINGHFCAFMQFLIIEIGGIQISISYSC